MRRLHVAERLYLFTLIFIVRWSNLVLDLTQFVRDLFWKTVLFFMLRGHWRKFFLRRLVHCWHVKLLKLLRELMQSVLELWFQLPHFSQCFSLSPLFSNHEQICVMNLFPRLKLFFCKIAHLSSRFDLQISLLKTWVFKVESLVLLIHVILIANQVGVLLSKIFDLSLKMLDDLLIHVKSNWFKLSWVDLAWWYFISLQKLCFSWVEVLERGGCGVEDAKSVIVKYAIFAFFIQNCSVNRRWAASILRSRTAAKVLSGRWEFETVCLSKSIV